ncbi:hypothetical protein EIN_424940 [Entamoeba invadens IP1]|uniref:Vesicle transport protein n=1 Tax=Entamoeba invadens IP1 TaxID=370355 RepID=A0A0A1U5X0_ENTIV|nr:hypothetical protein EIN_424940 [Entamoeba invadens IP1]ELP89772.1 hypothetical protein EIN_424940 [Entamoeba invadens IP1]|eukprot:XP_004256543.1 hypothetical protein EIN_424940 [Entamoeba invadens IP1]
MAAAMAFLSGGDVEEGASFASENPFEKCGLNLSVKVRMICFASTIGIGMLILIIMAAIFSVLGDNGGVYFFMVMEVIGVAFLLVSPFFLYGFFSMLKKIIHPFRVIALVTVLLCTVLVLILAPVMGADAYMFVIFGTIGEIFAAAFFGISLLPCFDALTGRCCGGFFSTAAK